MNEVTRSALAELNHAFYARFADDFARTRRGWSRGFERILPYLHPEANVLDLGCGNGRLLGFLSEHGWQGRYLGLDGSPGLLAAAEACSPGAARGISSPELVPVAAENVFRYANLLNSDWTAALNGFTPDAIACLAVLHHIPGARHRARLVAECARLLAPGGTLIMSVWQFANTPRLQTRILPWSTVGLKAEDVEPGDYLLGWGEGAAVQRYCAAIDEETLCSLSSAAGMGTVETFYADGHEGNLSLYGIFRANAT